MLSFVASQFVLVVVGRAHLHTAYCCWFLSTYLRGRAAQRSIND